MSRPPASMKCSLRRASSWSMASSMTPSVWALSLIGSRLAKMLKEKNTNSSIRERSISPRRHCSAAASASPTLPHFSASRCSALPDT